MQGGLGLDIKTKTNQDWSKDVENKTFLRVSLFTVPEEERSYMVEVHSHMRTKVVCVTIDQDLFFFQYLDLYTLNICLIFVFMF